MHFKKWLALSIALLLPLQALAGPGAGQYANPQPPYINITAPNQLDGVNINPNTSAAGNFTTLSASGVFSPNGGTATQGTVFSTVLSGNPLSFLNFQTIPVASVNSGAGQLLLSGVVNRTIFVNGVTALVSGTASGATAVTFLCQPSGRTIGTFPVAQLVTSVPVSLYSSAGANTIAGAAAGTGCASGDSVYISHTGSNLATTTQVYPTLLYTIQ